MSLTPISQYAATSSTNLRLVSSVRAKPSPKASVGTLASGQVLQANGLSGGSNPDAKTSLNVAYDHLARQSDIGPGVSEENSSLKSYLASYEQNSSNSASSQSSGTLFKSSA